MAEKRQRAPWPDVGPGACSESNPANALGNCSSYLTPDSERLNHSSARSLLAGPLNCLAYSYSATAMPGLLSGWKPSPGEVYCIVDRPAPARSHPSITTTAANVKSPVSSLTFIMWVSAQHYRIGTRRAGSHQTSAQRLHHLSLRVRCQKSRQDG